jgi:hypothetical protein
MSNYEIEIKVNGHWVDPLQFSDFVVANATYNFYRQAMRLMGIEEMFLMSYVGEQRLLAMN